MRWFVLSALVMLALAGCNEDDDAEMDNGEVGEEVETD